MISVAVGVLAAVEFLFQEAEAMVMTTIGAEKWCGNVRKLATIGMQTTQIVFQGKVAISPVESGVVFEIVLQPKDVITIRINMKYSTAKKIVDQILKYDEVFNDLTPLLDKIEDANLRTELLRASAAVATSMYADLLLPLKRRFPELDIGDE